MKAYGLLKSFLGTFFPLAYVCTFSISSEYMAAFKYFNFSKSLTPADQGISCSVIFFYQWFLALGICRTAIALPLS